MYVSPSCYIVQRFFKYCVTDDDVGNIETCRNVPKNHDSHSNIPFLILSFLDFVVFVVKTNSGTEN